MNDAAATARVLPDLCKAPRARLFTTWRTVLYVDPASGELRHGPIDDSPANALFVADPASLESCRQGWLMHDTGNGLVPIVCLREHSGTISRAGLEDAPPEPTLLEVVLLERGLFGLRSGDLYLCAQPDSRLTLDKTTCSLWECFLASADWCSAPLRTRASTPGLAEIDWRAIRACLIDPSLRSQTRETSATKILIFGHTGWSHGRVYYDVSKALTEHGYVVDVLDWQVDQSGRIHELLNYYDFVISALDGMHVLIDIYGVPYERVIALSHAHMDMRKFVNEKGTAVFTRFAEYAVIGESLFQQSIVLGIPRTPKLLQLGVDFDQFAADPPRQLCTVGYSSSMSLKTLEGLEIKRGELAESAAREAGLAFNRPEGDQTSFHDMPEFYRSVDAVLISSVIEAAGLPAREAAATGRLVIGTPVGDFPIRAAQGCGIIAPIDSDKFKEFVAAQLRYYKMHPAEFAEKCRQIQNAARELDWSYMMDDWIELVESARRKSVSPYGQIYVINLDRSRDRLHTFRARNSHLNGHVRRFTGIDGTEVDRKTLVDEGIIAEDLPYAPGTLGCALSHIALWQQAVAEDKVMTIFEDDVICSRHFLESSEKILLQLGSDWGLVQWGYNYNPSFVWVDWGIGKAKVEAYELRFQGPDSERFSNAEFHCAPVKLLHSVGALAYSVSPRGARALLQYSLPLRKRVISFPGTDIAFEDGGIDCTMSGAYESIGAYLCVPPLVKHDDDLPSDRYSMDVGN